MFQTLFPNVVDMKAEFIDAIWQTIYMTLASAFFAGILGLATGILLVITEEGGWRHRQARQSLAVSSVHHPACGHLAFDDFNRRNFSRHDCSNRSSGLRDFSVLCSPDSDCSFDS